MKLIFPVAAGIIFSWHLSVAADATFSKDATRVYFARAGKAELIEVDLAKRSCRSIDLKSPLNEPIEAIVLSDAGSILCATNHAIWSFDPSTAKSLKVCDAPAKIDLDDIAYDPATKEILAIGLSEESDSSARVWCAFVLSKGGNRLEKIYARYGTTIGHPVFGVDGTLFFVNRGDL